MKHFKRYNRKETHKKRKTNIIIIMSCDFVIKREECHIALWVGRRINNTEEMFQQFV